MAHPQRGPDKPGFRFAQLPGNNLKELDAAIPVGLFTGACPGSIGMTGVSGSGKSTLIQGTLYPRLLYELYGTRTTWELLSRG